MRNIKVLFLSLFVLLLFSTTVSAQTDDELDLIERAQMVAEIKRLRAENLAKDEIIKTKDSQIEVFKQLDKVQEARIADLKESIKQRDSAQGFTDRMEALYDKRIEDYRAENQRLRDENAKLRGSRDKRSIISGIIGLVGGALLFR